MAHHQIWLVTSWLIIFWQWRTVLYADWLEGFIPSDAGMINAIAGVIILDSSLTEAIYIRWLERKRERSCYNWKRIVMRPSGRKASASGPKSMTSSIPYMTLPPTKGYPAPLRGNPCIQKKIGNNFNQRFEQWNAITLYRVVNIFQGNVNDFWGSNEEFALMKYFEL